MVADQTQTKMMLAIADDDSDWTKMVAKWAASALQTQPVEIRIFGKPDELTTALEAQGKTEGQKTIVFLDLEFVDGGSGGLDLLKGIKQHANSSIRNIPIIVYSRSNSQDEIERCYAENANSYVHKGDLKNQKDIFVQAVTFWVQTAKLPGTLKATGVI